VIGAGLAGLVAAGELQRAGLSVRVIDKGRGLGGRLATRRIGDAIFDHGSPCLDLGGGRLPDHWWQDRLGPTRVEWWPTTGAPGATVPCRWRGAPTMSAVAKHLALGLEVVLGTTLTSVRAVGSRWIASTIDGTGFEAGAVVLTPPVPQSLSLLDAGAVDLPPELRARLAAIEYDRCLTVMAVLEEPSRIPPPGGLAPDSGPLAWIIDNQAKGISPVPAATLHATARFSLENWDHDRMETARLLIGAASEWIGSSVRDMQVHGWRYSRARIPDGAPCVVASLQPPLVLAGDAYGPGGIEGAALSGLAAARTILRKDPTGT
jgi:renalase